MKSYSLSLGLGLCVAVVANACSKPTFSGTKTGTPPIVAVTKAGPPVAPTGSSGQSPATPKEATFDLSCDAELASAFSVKSTAGATGHFLDVSPTCSSVRSTTSSKTVTEAVDIVFVVDVTGSMGANISSIRTNIQRFVDKLVARGWDARFAALAFRDTGDSGVPAPIPFGAASQISSGLSSWQAIGGGDSQEGSQDAVAQAVRLFQDAGRPSAQKVVLLVTDELGYAMSDGGVVASHSDFSVTTLASKLKFAAVGNLRLFCAVSSLNRGTVSAASQCEDLRSQSGITGENLGFPLSESVLLEQFVTKFQVVNSNEELSCRLQGVTLEGAAVSVKLGNGVQRLPLGTQAEINAAAGKIVEVKRCCSVLASGVNGVLESAVCSDPVTRKVTLSVEK